MLLRVAYCAECGKPLYAAKKRDRAYIGYYRCLTCPVAVQITKIEDGVVSELRARWHGRPHKVRTIVPGDDYSKRIRQLQNNLAPAQQLELVDTAPLEAEIARLSRLNPEPDQEILVDTGKTMDEHWNSLDTPEQRGAYLRENGVRVPVARGGRLLVNATWFAEWNAPRMVETPNQVGG